MGKKNVAQTYTSLEVRFNKASSFKKRSNFILKKLEVIFEKKIGVIFNIT